MKIPQGFLNHLTTMSPRTEIGRQYLLRGYLIRVLFQFVMYLMQFYPQFLVESSMTLYRPNTLVNSYVLHSCTNKNKFSKHVIALSFVIVSHVKNNNALETKLNLQERIDERTSAVMTSDTGCCDA